jgi:septum site-determining protein MinC
MYAERSSGPSRRLDPTGSGPTGLTARPVARIAVRGRSFLALVVAPEAPLDRWFAALDAQMRAAPDFLAARPLIVDLAATSERGEGAWPLVEALDGLVDRKLKVVGVEGIDVAQLAGTRWARLPLIPNGRDAPREVERERPPPAAERPAAAARSLLIERSLRSGQSVWFEDGDVTIIGQVASGAEVVAGGSVHVYGALRGRAIAGVAQGESARIFCQRLEAELIAVGGFYRTADDWGANLQGRPVQIGCEKGALRLAPLE